MTMTIEISPELKSRLEAEAAKRQQTPEEYARTLIEKSLPLTGRPGRSWSEIEGAARFPLAVKMLRIGSRERGANKMRNGQSPPSGREPQPEHCKKSGITIKMPCMSNYKQSEWA